jgi:hypothetical protein
MEEASVLAVAKYTSTDLDNITFRIAVNGIELHAQYVI